ncbi:TolC family protein [Carboxylicivirga linearis]|uniref:TolC family protein n=1 Tax=Carboxylicivirga linearis TaxID=1628157 RepID=A0ABS5JS74_9BACT|nr:TolC family protein [Carboxylicivirga linearis]MBS2097655.1 TolC family protein [Carboxylicivirga linearis]
MKKQIIYIFTLILLSAYSQRGYSQEEMTLNDAIITGLANNFDIQIGEMNYKIAQVQNSWGNAGKWPSISLSLGMNNSLNDRFNETNQTGYFSGSLQANWVLFDGFAVNIRKSRLEYLERISGGNAAVLVENTIQAIILGFNNVLLEQERREVLESVMNLSKDRYDYIQHKADLGAGSTYEVSQAKGDWLTDRANYLNQDMTLQSTKRQLTYLLALAPESEIEITGSLTPDLMEYELAALIDKMTTENRTLQNQYLNLSVLDKALQLEKSARYPTLSFSTGISSNYYPDGLNTNDNIAAFSGTYSTFANLSLSYNLFNGNQVNRNIEIAEIQEQIGEVQLADMKSQLTIQLHDFFALYNVRKELYELQTENLETAQLNMDLSTEKYRNGAISSFDFRNAQRTYLETAIRQIQSVYNLIETNTNLIRITGGIIAEFGE